MEYRILYLLVSSIAPFTLSAVSMVYNFRVAQITKQPIVENQNNNATTLLVLPFDQFLKNHTGVFQNFAGGMGSFMYDFKSWYFRADFAASHIHETYNHHTIFSGTETDDFLFTLGRNFRVDQHTMLTLSGLFGVPTHRLFALQHAMFGYGQIGTGLQLDGSYTFRNAQGVLYGARYIYFVPRNACTCDGEKYRFTTGHLTDLLVAWKKNWDAHGLELGFTERFQFGAHVRPNFDEIVQKSRHIRSSFYAVYKYRFLIKDIPNRFLCNIAYGFDTNSKKYGDKYIVTLWASWNINF